MTTFTPELRQAIERAGEQAVELTDPETNTSYVLVRADVYRRMKEIMEEEGRREHEAWAKLAHKARSDWASENTWDAGHSVSRL